MATSGRTFLRLSKAREFVLSSHARERLAESAGFPVTRGLAHALFNGSRQVRYDELYLLGYRPNYAQRAQHGVRSWYFLFRIFRQEFVAVVSEGREPGSFIWVTTYTAGREVALFRLLEPAALSAAIA